jgi:hypothetical protein
MTASGDPLLAKAEELRPPWRKADRYWLLLARQPVRLE